MMQGASCCSPSIALTGIFCLFLSIMPTGKCKEGNLLLSDELDHFVSNNQALEILDDQNISKSITIILSPDVYPLMNYDESIIELTERGGVVVFSSSKYSKFSRLLYAQKDEFLFVVAGGENLLKLDGKTLKNIDYLTILEQSPLSPRCASSNGCQKLKEINLLSHTNVDGFIWYCSVHFERYSDGILSWQPSVSECVIPRPENVQDRLLTWDSSHFTSTNPKQTPVVVMVKEKIPFLYIATESSDFLQIARLQLPALNGNIDWSGALFTPNLANFVKASVVYGFETPTAVYFIVNELSEAMTKAAQIVRICKGDQGGIPHISEQYFGSLAKATLVCTSSVIGTGGYEIRFTFPRVKSAFWNSNTQRLYSIFVTEEAAPSGSAVCIFTLLEIENVFRGPVYSQSARRNLHRANPFRNICDRLSLGNLTKFELDASRIAMAYINRLWAVQPIFGHAIIMTNAGNMWKSIIGFGVAGVSGTVLWLASQRELQQVVVFESGNVSIFPYSLRMLDVCEIRSIHMDIETLETINFMIMQNESAYVTTSEHVFRFPLIDCTSHRNEAVCQADPYCGWRGNVCSILSRPMGPRKCPSQSRDSGWSDWKVCKFDGSVSCRCRICTNPQVCQKGRHDISKCTSDFFIKTTYITTYIGIGFAIGSLLASFSTLLFIRYRQRLTKYHQRKMTAAIFSHNNTEDFETPESLCLGKISYIDEFHVVYKSTFKQCSVSSSGYDEDSDGI